MQDENYTPFGEDWKKEMKKLPKSILIDMLRTSFKKVNELEKELSTAHNCA